MTSMRHIEDRAFWLEGLPPLAIPEQPLPGKADVAVIGGGYAGLSAARTLAQAGRDVALLEAEWVGFGASSRNCGYLMHPAERAWHDNVAGHGPKEARRDFDETLAANQWVLDLIEQNQLDVRLERKGRYYAAFHPQHYTSMGREMEDVAKFYPVEFEMVEPGRQRGYINSPLYHGGKFVGGMAHLQPGRYVRELGRITLNAGVRIHERTRVTGIRREGGGFAVETSRGRLEARNVIVATNAYTGPALGGLHRSVTPVIAHVVITAPDAKIVDRLYPGEYSAVDTKRNRFCIRRTPGEPRLMFTSRTGVQFASLEDSKRAVMMRFRWCFPDAEGLEASHVWSGYVAIPHDHRPHIGAQRDGIHYAMGCGGGGVVRHSYLGHRIAQDVLGLDVPRSYFATGSFKPLPAHRRWPLSVEIVAASYDVRDRVLAQP